MNARFRVKDARLNEALFADDVCPEFQYWLTHTQAPDYRINAAHLVLGNNNPTTTTTPPKAYIITQCPTRDTLDDFVGMIMRNHVRHLVCLCNFSAQPETFNYRNPNAYNHKPYHLVFTDRKTHDVGSNIVYTTTTVEVVSNHDQVIVRTFTLHKYRHWEDCTENLPNPDHLWAFVNGVPHDQGCVMVHCLMGVNRSASFIMMHYLSGLPYRVSPFEIGQLVEHIRSSGRRAFLLYNVYYHMILRYYDLYATRHGLKYSK